VAGLLQAREAGQLVAGSVVVCTLTGHGLKDPETAVAGASMPAPVGVDVIAAALALDL
jgi:threonine synthase